MKLRVADFHYPYGSAELRCRSCNVKLGEAHTDYCFYTQFELCEPGAEDSVSPSPLDSKGKR